MALVRLRMNDAIGETKHNTCVNVGPVSTLPNTPTTILRSYEKRGRRDRPGEEEERTIFCFTAGENKVPRIAPDESRRRPLLSSRLTDRRVTLAVAILGFHLLEQFF